jgi:hypothetical protein
VPVVVAIVQAGFRRFPHNIAMGSRPSCGYRISSVLLAGFTAVLFPLGLVADYNLNQLSRPESGPVIRTDGFPRVFALVPPLAGRSCWISNPIKQKPTQALICTLSLPVPTPPAASTIETSPGFQLRPAEAYVFCGRSPPKL